MKLYQIFIFIGVFSLTSAVLTGCTASTKENTENYVLPEGLKDCKIYTMEPSGLGGHLQVVRCPNSATTTTYKSGKSTRSVTLLEEQLKEAKLKESALEKLTDEEKQALGIQVEE